LYECYFEEYPRRWSVMVARSDTRRIDRCHISLIPKVRLYIATSLDGFVGDLDSGVNCLFDSVEVLIMGRRTYEQVLRFGEDRMRESPPTCSRVALLAVSTRMWDSSPARWARSFKNCVDA